MNGTQNKSDYGIGFKPLLTWRQTLFGNYFMDTGRNVISQCGMKDNDRFGRHRTMGKNKTSTTLKSKKKIDAIIHGHHTILTHVDYYRIKKIKKTHRSNALF